MFLMKSGVALGARRNNGMLDSSCRERRSAFQHRPRTSGSRLKVSAISIAPATGKGLFGFWGNKDPRNSPATIDQRMLTLNPATEVGPGSIKELFGYPRNVDERYKVKERLGKGSFGVVSRVVDRETGKEYACKSLAKIPPSKQVATGRHLLKIWNEIDCLKLLGRSLDAVSLMDVFEDDKYVHFIMELCPGGQLLELLNSVNRVSEERAVSLMRSVMRFVAQCHSKSIVYRDVNPVNFLFTSDGRLQATDFGLAVRHAPSDPPIVVRAGTPVYMSPEAVAREYNSKADVWSAGILCFQLLAGRYPYWSTSKIPPETTLDQLFDIITSHEIDYDEFEKLGVSSTAVDFLRKVLTKNPHDRLTAAEALEHPWFKESFEDDCCFSDLDCSIVQRLQHFAGNAHFRQYVLNLIADNIIFGAGGDLLSRNEKTSQLNPLVRMFQRLDKDDSGELDSGDLLAELHDEGYNLTDAEMNKLLRCIRNNNNDERILLDEFCTRLLDWSYFQKHRSWLALLRHAFDEIDVDGDSLISVSDVTEVLTSSTQSLAHRKAQAHDILREFSTSAVVSGITWSAFCELFTEYDLSIGSLTHFDRRYVSDSSICDATFDV